MWRSVPAGPLSFLIQIAGCPVFDLIDWCFGGAVQREELKGRVALVGPVSGIRRSPRITPFFLFGSRLRSAASR
jgi:hypothetical protein